MIVQPKSALSTGISQIMMYLPIYQVPPAIYEGCLIHLRESFFGRALE